MKVIVIRDITSDGGSRWLFGRILPFVDYLVIPNNAENYLEFIGEPVFDGEYVPFSPALAALYGLDGRGES